MRIGKHFRFLFLDVVLKQFLQHFQAPGELLGIRLGLLEIRQHQGIHRAVFLLGFIEHLRLFLVARCLQGGIEDLFFDGGMHGQLQFDLAEQLVALLAGAIGGFGDFRQELLDHLVILLE
ncbi:hypothetical protein D3C80_1505080 [compost metagenome]